MKTGHRQSGDPDRQSALRRIDIFAGLSDGELKSVSSLTREQKARKGAVLFHQFDEGGGLYLIVEGTVKVSRIGKDGREVTVALLREGTFFGDMSLLDGQPRSATATAVSPCRFLLLDRESLFGTVLPMTEVAARMLAELSKRLRAANQNIENLALGSVFDRLFHFLGHFGRRFPPEEGCVVIRNRPTHQELSEIVGSSRETVTRTLAAMEKEGFIEIRKREIVLLPGFFEAESSRS